MAATAPNLKIMALMGVRFIVTDRADLTNLAELTRFAKFRVVETSHPNLGSYSPTNVVRASTAVETLDHLRSDTFDPQANVLVESNEELPELVAGSAPELRFTRAGYSVRASSPGWSLLILPVQYSHCYVHSGAAAQGARLLRVNLVQTGLLIHGEASVRVDFRHWPFASPDCQRQDYADALTLRVGDLQRSKALPDDSGAHG